MNSNSDRITKYDTDIVVIGGGGAGLSAAVTASELGAAVTVLEKSANVGGNSIMAGGLFAADSIHQRRMSIAASKDDIFKLAMDYAHWKIDPMIFRSFIEKSASTIDWLEKKGIELSQIPSLYPGQVFRTWHCCPEWPKKKWAGYKIIKALLKECEERGVNLFLKCAAKKIVTDKKGNVTGVIAIKDGKEIQISSKRVIIATGGYGGNKELLKKYHPSYSDNLHRVGKPLKGDGLGMAVAAGAATDGLGTILLHPHIFTGSKQVDAFSHEPYLVWVNKKGERFVDESIVYYPTDCGNAIDRQPDKCIYVLSDNKMNLTATENGVLTIYGIESGYIAGSMLPDLESEFQLQANQGKVVISNSWDDIAKWIGVQLEVLRKTIDEYNSYCDQGYDERFAKDRKYLKPLNSPPYYAIRCYPTFLTTIGGIKINHHMEVLKDDGCPLRGLYATGDIAGGWQSDTYCIELSGSAFGFAVNSGRIAAERAVETLKAK